MSRHDLGGSRAPRPGLGQPGSGIAVGGVGPGRRDDEVPAEPASVEPVRHVDRRAAQDEVAGVLLHSYGRLDEDGDAGGLDEGRGREVDD